MWKFVYSLTRRYTRLSPFWFVFIACKCNNRHLVSTTNGFIFDSDTQYFLDIFPVSFDIIPRENYARLPLIFRWYTKCQTAFNT